MRILFFLICITNIAYSQTLTGISTKWNDSFVEWSIFSIDEEDDENEIEIGALAQRWQMNNDWTQWDYTCGANSGTIRQKFKDDLSQWDIRGEGIAIYAKTKWLNDFREWRITDNEISITLVCSYNNNAEEWFIREKDYGKFSIYTSVEGDPRDWTIIDELDENINMTMKMALVSIAILNSVPKY